MINTRIKLPFLNSVDRCLLTSMLFYAVGGTLRSQDKLLIGNLFEFLSVLIFFYIILFLPSYSNKTTNRFTYLLLISWIILMSFGIAFSSYPNSWRIGEFKNSLAKLLLSPYWVPGLFPIVLCKFRSRFIDFSYHVKFFIILSLFFLLAYPFVFKHMLNFEWSMAIGFSEEGGYEDFMTHSTLGLLNLSTPSILVFWKQYMSKRKWILLLVAYSLPLFMLTFLARRGTVLIYFLTLFLASCFYYPQLNHKSKCILVTCGAAILLIVTYVLFCCDFPFFELLIQRGLEDTRTGVELEFYNDMKSPLDWIFGRGWFGAYHCSWGEFRNSIETGYLALILRGGLIYLLLYLSLLFFSAYRGLLKSNNQFVKSFSIIILISILELYPFGWPLFTFDYMYVWVGVYLCLNRKYLKMSDSEINIHLFKNKNI